MQMYFNMLCNWLDSEAEKQYTLNELVLKMSEFSNGGTVYSTKCIKQKLQYHYKDSVVFAEIEGRQNVVCFKHTVSSIISEKWYRDRKNREQEEAERIVETAAKIILSEIRAIKPNMGQYPTKDDIVKLKQESILPKYLQTFMKVLIKTPLRQESIGQSIVFSMRPRSVIPPIIFGLGVELDQAFGSRWLLDDLYKLGFSISYTEVTRYKQNVMQTNNVEDIILDSDSASNFTQWVGDNVDHNISTLDGKNTFHGMGIISATTGRFGLEKIPQRKPIPRNKLLKANAAIANKGVKIVHYVSSDKPGLFATKFSSLESLQLSYTCSLGFDYDLVWYSGYYCRNMKNLRPSWSGFMQDTSIGSYHSKAQIHFLPIIDLSPTNLSCLYSTLLFIKSQAKKLNIITPCVNFDQQL